MAGRPPSYTLKEIQAAQGLLLGQLKTLPRDSLDHDTANSNAPDNHNVAGRPAAPKAKRPKTTASAPLPDGIRNITALDSNRPRAQLSDLDHAILRRLCKFMGTKSLRALYITSQNIYKATIAELHRRRPLTIYFRLHGYRTMDGTLSRKAGKCLSRTERVTLVYTPGRAPTSGSDRLEESLECIKMLSDGLTEHKLQYFRIQCSENLRLLDGPLVGVLRQQTNITMLCLPASALYRCASGRLPFRLNNLQVLGIKSFLDFEGLAYYCESSQMTLRKLTIDFDTTGEIYQKLAAYNGKTDEASVWALSDELPTQWTLPEVKNIICMQRLEKLHLRSVPSCYLFFRLLIPGFFMSNTGMRKLILHNCASAGDILTYKVPRLAQVTHIECIGSCDTENLGLFLRRCPRIEDVHLVDFDGDCAELVEGLNNHKDHLQRLRIIPESKYTGNCIAGLEKIFVEKGADGERTVKKVDLCEFKALEALGLGLKSRGQLERIAIPDGLKAVGLWEAT